MCYNGRRVCREITFEVLAGERIALQGANGCGKSSLLKLLLGEEIPHSGTVETMSGLVVSYVSQNTDHLRGSLTEFVRTQGLDGSRFGPSCGSWMFHGSSLRRTWQITAAARRKRCCWPQASAHRHTCTCGMSR